jgi:L-lysine exporter family protein LysE/ArgO
MQWSSSTDFFAGFATSGALIIAIGSQNAFLLRQGILRQHVLPLVLFCAVSDALLILLGVGGAGVLIRDNVLLMNIARFGGALFLLVYGLLAARRAWQGTHLTMGESAAPSLNAALMACFGFTYLNPHVYLDTVVLMGSIANQRPDPDRWVFAAGACIASGVWFSALGFGARYLAPWFQTTKAWRVLDTLVALVMFMLATMLLQS